MGKKSLLLELAIRSALPPFYSFSLIENVCKKKLEKRQNDKDILWVLSNLYISYKKYGEAKRTLETLLNSGIDTKHVRLLLSNVYFKLGEYIKVKEILSDGKTLSEKDKENYYLGDSLIRLECFGDAIIFLNNYIKYYPDEYVPFVRLGYAYYMQGSYILALEAYKHADKLKPLRNEIKESIDLCIEKLKKKENATGA